MVDENSKAEDTENVTHEEVRTPLVLPVTTYPADALRAKAQDVPEDKFGTEWLNELIMDMFYNMRIRSGIGMAAVQIGRPVNVIVLHLEQPIIMVNPIIVAEEGTQQVEEGCLSVPGYFATVDRAEIIRVVYRDEEGTPKDLRASGISAACIQHEIDHLNGVLFVEYLSPFKQSRAKRKVEKFLKAHPGY